MKTLHKVLDRYPNIVEDVKCGNLLAAMSALRYEFWRLGCFIEDEGNDDFRFIARCSDGDYTVEAEEGKVVIRHGGSRVEIP